MTRSILYFENCGHSPAWPLIPRAVNDLDQAGLSFHPYQPPVWSDPALVCTNQTGQAKGFLIYRYDKQRCSWFILLAYTLPSHRRTGVHTALFEALVERGRKRGDILSIDSGTHVANEAAQRSFEAQGRKRTAITFEYRLRDWLEGGSHLDVQDTGKTIVPAEKKRVTNLYLKGFRAARDLAARAAETVETTDRSLLANAILAIHPPTKVRKKPENQDGS